MRSYHNRASRITADQRHLPTCREIETRIDRLVRTDRFSAAINLLKVLYGFCAAGATRGR
jgi:hypothetical protein